MTTFKSFFLLAAALISAGSLAAEESGKELTWPVAARDGAEHHYDTSTLSTEEKDGKKKQVSSESTTVVKHRADGNGGFVQTWSWRDSKSKYEGYEDAESGLREMLAEALGDIELQVSLDKDTYYSKLINSEEIAGKMKAMFDKAFDEGMKNARDQKRESWTAGQQAEFDAMRKNMVATMTSPIAIENIAGKTPQLFNFFNGGGLDPTSAFELDEEGANPFGGKPFPLKVHMELNLLEDDPGYVQATYISSLDREKGVPILIEGIEKLMNEKIPEAERKMLTGNIEITHRADMRIRLSDGLIHFFRQTETKNVVGKKEVSQIEMTLVEKP